jgi:hypothetical protein
VIIAIPVFSAVLAIGLMFAPLGIAAKPDRCAEWPAWPSKQMQALTPCGLSAQSQIGALCVEAQWLCSDQSLAQWVEALLDEIDEHWVVGHSGDGLVFSGEQGDVSWAVFWGLQMSQAGKLTLLASRLRAVQQER